MNALAVTIGAAEIGVILTILGLAFAAATLYGRWLKGQSDKLKEAKADGEEEALQKAKLLQLEADLRDHKEEIGPVAVEFEKYKVLVQGTTRDVNTLTDRMGDVLESNRDLSREVRDLSQTVRKLLSGEIAWRPQDPGKPTA